MEKVNFPVMVLLALPCNLLCLLYYVVICNSTEIQLLHGLVCLGICHEKNMPQVASGVLITDRIGMDLT